MTPHENARNGAGANVDSAGGLNSTNQIDFSKSTNDETALQSRSTSTKAQRMKLLAFLRCGPQTTYSLRKHGIAQCAARIWELRKEGYIIVTENVIAVDSDGFTHIRVALYSLIRERAVDVEVRNGEA